MFEGTIKAYYFLASFSIDFEFIFATFLAFEKG